MPTNDELQSSIADLQTEIDEVKDHTIHCSSTRTRVLILTEAVKVLARGVKLSDADLKEFDDLMGQF